MRFASHYRDFLSLEELQEEFERLASAPRRSPRRSGANQPPLLPPTALDVPVGQTVDINDQRRGRRIRR